MSDDEKIPLDTPPALRREQPNGTTESETELFLNRYPELFHYTSISALRGMLETNTLWATRVSHLNDTSEMKRLWPHLEAELIRAVVSQLEKKVSPVPEARKILENGGGAANLASVLVKEDLAVIRAVLRGESDILPNELPYVLSFTTHNGSAVSDTYHRRHGMLSQWHGYARGQGVAVVFDTKRIHALTIRETSRYNYWPAFFGDVIYDDAPDIPAKLPDLFARMEEIARRTIARLGGKEEKPYDEEHLSEIAIALMQLKHHAFREEQELRIVFTPALPENESKMKEIGELPLDKHFKLVRHRAGVLGDIPYIELFGDLGESLPIKRIIVGPSRHQLANKEQVCQLVGKRDIEVTLSETPFVGSS